jgi:hypothetical protein
MDPMTTIRDFSALDCTCPQPDHYANHGSYVIGCPRHTAMALAAGPYVGRADIVARQVTYFHATVKVGRPVLGSDGNVWSQDDSRECDHMHATVEAAEKCAEKMANQLRKGK